MSECDDFAGFDELDDGVDEIACDNTVLKIRYRIDGLETNQERAVIRDGGERSEVKYG